MEIKTGINIYFSISPPALTPKNLYVHHLLPLCFKGHNNGVPAIVNVSPKI